METYENPDGGYRPGSNPGSSHPDAQASPLNTDNFKQQARRQVHDLVDEAKEETSRMAGQAGDMVQGLIGKQKDQAVEKLGGVAGALREVGNRLQQEDVAGIGRYAVSAAGQVDRFSGYLRDRDLKTFVRDTEGFARRHPDVFLGGTFLAGLVLARFLKSSSSSREEQDHASNPGERFGRGVDLGGLPTPSWSADRTGPYGTTTGVRFPDTPEGA